MVDTYRIDVINPGDLVSQLAHDVNLGSYVNCPAVSIIPHGSANFRGPVGYRWKRHILEQMLQECDCCDWRMLEEIENDGAGGKPQFFTMIGTPEVFRNLGWEIIAMTADDFARSGRFPAIIANELNVQRITKQNLPLMRACLVGYGEALRQAHLVNITGETAVMKHSITAFCDEMSDEQLVMTWGATCIGLAHRERLIDGATITPGMPIVGFWEQGYRCNGGTFFTNLLHKKYGHSARIRGNSDAMKFVERLTVPSRSYARTICRLIGWQDDGNITQPLARVAGIAHITGGGVWGKFGEILPAGVGANLDKMPGPAQVLIDAQAMSYEVGTNLTDWQAYSTFHGGCGMLVVCATTADAERVIAEAKQDRIAAYLVGTTTESADRLITINSRFLEGKQLRSDQPS